MENQRFLVEKSLYQSLLSLLVCMKKRTVVLLSSSCRKIDSYKLQIYEGSAHDTIFSSFRSLSYTSCHLQNYINKTSKFVEKM